MDNQNTNHQNPVVEYTRREFLRLTSGGVLGLGVGLALGGTLDSHKEEPNTDVDKYMNALGKGIAHLESVQAPPSLWEKGEFEGEFGTDSWKRPDQSDKKYVFTLFTTPFVIHALNILETIPMNKTQIEAINAMKDRAAAQLMRHMESIDNYTGVWSFFGKPGYRPKLPIIFSMLPPDFCDTSCTLEAVLRHNPDYSTMISPGLTDYFLNYRVLNYRDPDYGAFYTWLTKMRTDKCTGTNANILNLYASRGEQGKIQSTMTWLNSMIDNMIAGEPYHAFYYKSPFASTYLITRAYADGGAKELLNTDQIEKLRKFILSSQRSDGSWPSYDGTTWNELETALASVSLLNLGDKDDAEKGIAYLLEKQSKYDGSWHCAPFYTDFINFYGSDKLTTAIAMEAIAKYCKKVSDKPLNGIEQFLSELFGHDIFRLYSRSL